MHKAVRTNRFIYKKPHFYHKPVTEIPVGATAKPER